MCGHQLQREGRLRGDAIVATVMSNIGLELALKPLGIDLVRTSVGDKYVMEEMLQRGLSLGGEQSGHIIFSDYLFTGDGLCTALNVLRTVALHANLAVPNEQRAAINNLGYGANAKLLVGFDGRPWTWLGSKHSPSRAHTDVDEQSESV